jgi:tRNA A37 threonylcarbamoyladenosine synthetase subunit TsaC/SUA5/YrdC
VSTSANTQNYPAAETREDVESYFLNKLSFVISGAVDSAGSVSEIIDLVTGEVIRNG